MSSKTVLETLEAARELITDPARWTQKAYARDALGSSLFSTRDPNAVCWCAQGAIRRVSELDSDDKNRDAYAAVADASKGASYSLFTFNDAHTHAEVLAAFDAAIAKEKEAQHVL